MTSDKRAPTFSFALPGDKFETFVKLECYEALLAEAKQLAEAFVPHGDCVAAGFSCDFISLKVGRCPCATVKELMAGANNG